LLVAAASSPVVAAPHLQPTIRFGSGVVIVEGATPHGRVDLCGIGLGFESGQQSLVYVENENRADDGGQIAFPAEKLSFQSIWIALDVTSGKYSIASPPGFSPRRMPTPPTAIAPDGRHIRDDRPLINVFVGRKGAGAWLARAADGADADADGPKNGRVSAALERLAALGETAAAPQKLTPGDIVFVVDPRFMEFWSTEIQPGQVGGQ